MTLGHGQQPAGSARRKSRGLLPVIKHLCRSAVSLTRINTISMVRAAFRAAEHAKPEIHARSKAWLTNRAAKVNAKNRRTTRLLSPRGSSVSANGSQQANRPSENGSGPRHDRRCFGVRPRLPAVDRTGRRRARGRDDRLAARPLAGHFAVGADRVSAARLRGRRSQRDAGGRVVRDRQLNDD